MDAATHNGNRLTAGQPTVLLMMGPANFRPYPKRRMTPVRTEMTENEMAKFENPPISREPLLCQRPGAPLGRRCRIGARP